jgi:molecular chaperone HscA
VDAQRLLEATQAALAVDGELLAEDERAQVDEALVGLREAAHGEDTDAIEAATKALAAQTDEFAARRMNKSIRQALTGRKLNEL